MIVLLFVASACKKEPSCQDCNEPNVPVKKAPVANAGADKDFNAHLLDSLVLNGASSLDPDGIVVSYKWRTIGNNVSAQIVKDSSAATRVDVLARDQVYHFELTVKDNDGLSAKDTVAVNVRSQALNTVRFDSLQAMGDTCTFHIPNISTHVPSSANLKIYVCNYGGVGGNFYYNPWIRLDTIPFPVFHPTLPPGSYNYWYKLQNDTLVVYIPGNILCDWDPSIYDLLIKWD